MNDVLAHRGPDGEGFYLNDGKLRKSMGNKGRKRTNSHFSIDKLGNEFEIVYKEVLARKNRLRKISK